MLRFKILFVLVLTLLSHAIYAQSNFLTGKVTDSRSGEALAGATISINEIKGKGAMTDTSGNFKIKIPLGAYSITISMLGYTTQVKTDIIIQAGRETSVSVRLTATSVEMGAVTIKGDYFDKSIQVNNVSTVVLNAEEVRRSPGAIQDFQRILQSMPGVSFSSDENNELLVRGGAPDQNLIVFDDMEIHSVNHYPNEFTSGGPINMINVDLIQDIQFSSGGFNAKYGDKLSSVVMVNSREGRRIEGVSGNANISMAGAGGIFEGGFASGRGSWLVSVRKSYLDLIKGAIGLSAVPKYYDGQFKVAYDFNPMHKLSISGIYGNDYINIEGNTDDTFPEKAGSTDTVGVERDLVKQNQGAVGATLKSLWAKNLFSSVTLFMNRNQSKVTVYNDFTRRDYNASGGIYYSDVLTKRLIYGEDFIQGEGALKFDINWLATQYYELSAGGSFRSGFYKNTVDLDADTARYDLNHDGIFEVPQVVVPAASITTDIKLFEQNKQYYYINNRFKLFDERMMLNAGLRYDYFSYSKAENISPRLSLTYYLIPQITSINLAYGYFYQTQSYPVYGDRYLNKVNIGLQNSRAVHYVLGLEHIINDGMKFNIEGYYKKYDRIPVSEEFIHFDDKTFRSEKKLNAGEYYVCGVDALLQQKLVHDIYGTLSFSWMQSRVKDPRIGYEGRDYPSDYEFPYLLTIIMGKRFSELRNDLNEMPFYIRYPSYILPLSNDMEISLKWRYASGKPYTDKVFTTYEQHRAGGITWSKGAWNTGDDMNGSRYTAYQRLDLMLNSRYNFDKWNLVVSFSLQNVYNQKNVAGYSHEDDGTKSAVHQYSLFPVLGVEIEF